MVRRASICCVLSVALIVTAIPVSASAAASISALDEHTLRCESSGRRRYCPGDTDGRVELVRQLSKSRCDQWRSWGYDRRGVWVDRGCRGEFRIGKDGGIGTGGAVAIGGAVAGAAILAAILANKNNDHKDEAVGALDWMVGRFRGFSPLHDRDFDITVERNGTVTGDSQGDRLSGHVTKDRLHLGDSQFKLQKESWGFQATEVDDSKDVIYFRKQ